MSKHSESAADQLWKEKRELCGSPRETGIALLVIVIIAALL